MIKKETANKKNNTNAIEKKRIHLVFTQEIQCEGDLAIEKWRKRDKRNRQEIERDR